MKKNNKLFLLFLLLVFFLSNVNANDNINFLSLKYDEVNLRQGPSKKYPVKLIYQKKYLPVMIIDSFETWRKIKDYKSNSGWIHIAQLSKKKSAININNNSILYKKPTIFSRPVLRIETGRLVLIEKCKISWCKIKSGGFVGWVLKDSLWGST